MFTLEQKIRYSSVFDFYRLLFALYLSMYCKRQSTHWISLSTTGSSEKPVVWEMTKCLWFHAELFLTSSSRRFSTKSSSLSHRLYSCRGSTDGAAFSHGLVYAATEELERHVNKRTHSSAKPRLWHGGSPWADILDLGPPGFCSQAELWARPPTWMTHCRCCQAW